MSCQRYLADTSARDISDQTAGQYEVLRPSVTHRLTASDVSATTDSYATLYVSTQYFSFILGFFRPPNLHLASSEQWCWPGGRGILIELSLCKLHIHNEQFFQIDLLDCALLPLGLAPSPPSTSLSWNFIYIFIHHNYGSRKGKKLQPKAKNASNTQQT